ncbi:MAG: thioredoxin-dependent thiol peroxidase [Candidatus Promineifilaceae bacterium]
MLQPGNMAPDFELPNEEGRPVKLSDYRGQRVILFFYPKADTPGCTAQACGFRDNFPRIEAAGATVLGISPDTPRALAKWKAKLDLPYSLLSDRDHAVAEAYSAWGERSFMGRNFMGIIRSHVVVGPDGRLENVQIKVRPAESVERGVEAVVA